jgi:hypothetical protein
MRPRRDREPRRWVRLLGLAECDVHGRAPVHAVLRPLMQRGHGLAIVVEHPGGTRVIAAPRPRPVAERQILAGDVALRVEKMSPVLLGLGVVADDLDLADVSLPEPAVGSVEQEEPAGHPLVDVARRDIQCG